MTDVEIIESLDSASEVAADWDALTVACSRPSAAPAWVLSWWQHVAGPEAAARIIVVRDRGRLIGLAPFAVESDRRYRCDFRLPGAEFGGELEPLAWPGREWEVATAVASAIASGMPRPDVIALEGIPFTSPWAAALQEQWPGPIPPYLRTYQLMGSPCVSLNHDSFDAWMAGHSSNFRSQMRRAKRRLEKAGGTVRTTTRATLSQDVASLIDLHTQRWANRGQSGLVAAGTGLARMLESVGDTLVDSGRFQLQIVDLEGRAIAAQLFLAAGDRILFVNGGWDPRYPQLIASQLNILHAIEQGITDQNARTLSLGPGVQRYKLRFSDGNEPVVWQMLLPPRARLPLTAARVAPALTRYRVRQLLVRGLTPDALARAKRVRSQLTAWRGRSSETPDNEAL